MSALLDDLAGRIESFIQTDRASSGRARRNGSNAASEVAALIAEAEARAQSIAAAGGDTVAARRESGLRFAADAMRSLVMDHGSEPEDLMELVERIAHVFDLTPRAAGWSLFLRAAGAPQLLQLPPGTASEVQLKLLAGLAPVSEVSLWAMVGGSFKVVASVGSEPTKRVRSVARDAFHTAAPATHTPLSLIQAAPVMRWRQPCAALAARARPEHREEVIGYLGEAATLLSPILERELLLEQNSGRERELVSASERRLKRIGFDLHDGPLQDVAALADDLRVAQTQLSQVLTQQDRDTLLGCFDDLTSRLTEIDRSLRELSHSLESSTVLELGLPEALRREVDNARRRTQIRLELDVEGDLETLTPSQRVAILRVVQESLTNVRDHSGATRATVTVRAWVDHVEARIEDNGHGFDVSTTAVSAARRGRLGLVGMSERIRLLGGTFSIRSEDNRGTSITLTVPRWKPLLGSPSEELSTV